MKGTARVITNVKPMAGGDVLIQLQVGDYVYGTLSIGGTDLIDFYHVYTKAGIKVSLGLKCKASVSGLTLTNEIEPLPPVDPPVPSVKRKATWTIEGKTYYFVEE